METNFYQKNKIKINEKFLSCLIIHVFFKFCLAEMGFYVSTVYKK